MPGSGFFDSRQYNRRPALSYNAGMAIVSGNQALLRQLSENSERYRDPLTVVDWGALSTDEDWLPEEAISLSGLPEFTDIPVDIRRRLSQYEFINTLFAGLWLERLFMQRLAARLGSDLPDSVREYFLHEIREESGHSLMFLKTLRLSGLVVDHNAWRAPRLADWLARFAPSRGTLFWAATVIAEDVPDKFNRYIRHADGINLGVRQIASVHSVDEARHIAAARSHLEQAAAALSPVARRVLTPVLRILLKKYVSAFYQTPVRFYELAGLTHGDWWRRRAAACPYRRQFVAERLAPTYRVLSECGFDIETR
jgi:hypothetical protein